jgi:hypothetical protein
MPQKRIQLVDACMDNKKSLYYSKFTHKPELGDHYI